MASSNFPTPLLDSHGPKILRQISSQGGYAYVSLISSAASGDISAAEAALELAWEQLHSGPWHSVLPVWRDAYSLACLYIAKIKSTVSCCGEEDDDECLRVLDLGIIMGGEVVRKDLDDAVKRIVKKWNPNGNGNGGGSGIRRGFDTAEVLKALPPKSLSCKTIIKRSALSLEGFLVDFILTGSPVIISDGMSHWPAMTKWNDMNYLKRVAGCRTVPVEVGKNYLCSDWKQELITFSEFLERIQSNECSSLGPTYLAQHQLFDQIQELRDDILVPDYCFAGGGELRSLNAWFGPAGTVTPLHHDPHHNILSQVVGKKYIRLYQASLSNELYPHGESMLSNSSQVDLDNIDTDKFPKIHDLEFIDCVLEEGEMLYIPPKWWHYVRSLTISFSVSFWWSDLESGNFPES